MPKPGGYLAMVIIGFFLGIIWGLLSIGSYNKMKNAIAMGDVVQARKSAKNITIIFIIGVVVNVLFILGSLAQ